MTQETPQSVRPCSLKLPKPLLVRQILLNRSLLPWLPVAMFCLKGYPVWVKPDGTGSGKNLCRWFLPYPVYPGLNAHDVTGHILYDMKSESFKIRKGPVFTNLLLADEINRAPAKTQAALLEVMQEQQVTLEGRSMPVGNPFMVLATRNPIEQEGTYPLPEAQLDRFCLKSWLTILRMGMNWHWYSIRLIIKPGTGWMYRMFRPVPGRTVF